MAAWESLLDGLTSAVLTTFGRQVSNWRPDGEPFDVTAILESGSEAESSPLGNNAAAVVRLSDFDPAPDKGDEVVIDSAAYKVVEVEARLDGSARLTLHLT